MTNAPEIALEHTFCAEKRGHPLKGGALQKDEGQAKKKTPPLEKINFFLSLMDSHKL